MTNANLVRFTVNKLSFENNIKAQKKIELGFSYSYNVKYAGNNTCVGELTAKITDKENPEDFAVSLTAAGVFSFKPGSKKELLHIETYNDMFPYVRAFITTLTAGAGFPPIIMPFIDISKKEIYRFEMDKNGKPFSPDDFVNPFDESGKQE